MSFKIHKVANNGTAQVSAVVNPYLTSLGVYAGESRTDNTFIGARAGENSSGSGNTYVGNESGRFSSGTQNTYLGDGTCSINPSSGNYNTFIGAEAGLNNTMGTGNVFLGTVAGSGNADGNSNIFIGQSAGHNNIGGDSNVLVGNNSGSTIVDGNSNICIGDGADTNNVSASNRIVLGHGVVGTMDNSVTFPSNLTGGGIGIDANFSAMGGGRLYPVVSSRRFKKNIHDFDINEELVYQLQPRQFTYTETNEQSIGFIAEEVEPLFPELVPKDNQGLPASVRYSQVCVILLLALKKLRQDLDDLKNILVIN